MCDDYSDAEEYAEADRMRRIREILAESDPRDTEIANLREAWERSKQHANEMRQAAADYAAFANLAMSEGLKACERMR